MSLSLTSTGTVPRRGVARVLVLAVLCTVSAASPSLAAARTVTAGATSAGPCHRSLAPRAAGRDIFRVTAPSRSIVSVTLRSAGDWDLAIFGAKGRVVAARRGSPETSWLKGSCAKASA
jgi:hypothetical protein